MKLRILAATALLMATAIANPVQAESAAPLRRLLATTLGILGLEWQLSAHQDANGPVDWGLVAQQPFSGFSGTYSEYTDTYNGFKLKVPAEFQLETKGATTIWLGPLLDGGAASFSINTVEMKGVSSQVMYDVNFKSKKDDRNYTEVVPVSVKFGNQTVLAFRCKEANNKPGSADMKDPSDIHRWHLFIFGNERFYTLGFAGPYAAFQSNKVQGTYEDIIKSIELIPTP